MQQEKVRRTGLIINSFSTMGTAVVLTGLIAQIFAEEGQTIFENPGKAFDGIYDAIKIAELSASEFDFATLLVFGVWAFSGLVAGVRAKSPSGGLFASIFGASLGVFLIVFGVVLGPVLEGILGGTESTVDLPDLDEYLWGVAFCMVFAALFGFASGRATKPQPIQRIRTKPKKVWKRAERWTCRKCRTELPPGALECPNCGYGVME
ncbi:MAG: zinc ribbon domain-containing protein [Promethearchaeota archaeon]